MLTRWLKKQQGRCLVLNQSTNLTRQLSQLRPPTSSGGSPATTMLLCRRTLQRSSLDKDIMLNHRRHRPSKTQRSRSTESSSDRSRRGTESQFRATQELVVELEQIIYSARVMPLRGRHRNRCLRIPRQKAPQSFNSALSLYQTT